jgi:hypothetical protein
VIAGVDCLAHVVQERGAEKFLVVRQQVAGVVKYLEAVV